MQFRAFCSNNETEKPVRYTTSQTAKIDIKENLGFNQKDEKELWYKKYVIAISLSAFMIYFFIIRDENDIDDFITNKDNCNKYTTLLQLTMKLEYCMKNNLPTKALESQINDLKLELGITDKN